jgi:hypothetical protein
MILFVDKTFGIFNLELINETLSSTNVINNKVTIVNKSSPRKSAPGTTLSTHQSMSPEDIFKLIFNSINCI